MTFFCGKSSSHIWTPGQPLQVLIWSGFPAYRDVQPHLQLTRPDPCWSSWSRYLGTSLCPSISHGQSRCAPNGRRRVQLVRIIAKFHRAWWGPAAGTAEVVAAYNVGAPAVSACGRPSGPSDDNDFDDFDDRNLEGRAIAVLDKQITLSAQHPLQRYCTTRTSSGQLQSLHDSDDIFADPTRSLISQHHRPQAFPINTTK